MKSMEVNFDVTLLFQGSSRDNRSHSEKQGNWSLGPWLRTASDCVWGGRWRDPGVQTNSHIVLTPHVHRQNMLWQVRRCRYKYLEGRAHQEPVDKNGKGSKQIGVNP